MPDAPARLLDAGHVVVLFRNLAGTYTAAAVREDDEAAPLVAGLLEACPPEGPRAADGPTPLAALDGVAGKYTGDVPPLDNPLAELFAACEAAADLLRRAADGRATCVEAAGASARLCAAMGRVRASAGVTA